MLIFRVKKIAENARGTTFTFNKGRERAEGKKKTNGGTGWGSRGFLFWVLSVEPKAPAQPHGPGPCEAPAGKKRSWETLGSPVLPQQARPGSGAALPTGAPCSFPRPGHSFGRGWFALSPPASAGESLHCPLGEIPHPS